MTILVLGATGNVGPHVVSSLTALGETPRVLVRDADRARTLLGDDVEVIARRRDGAGRARRRDRRSRQRLPALPPQLRDGRPAAQGHPSTAPHRHPHRQAVGHLFGHHARRTVRLPRALGGRTRAARQRPAVRHPAAELVHAGARRPADDVGAARDRHGRQPDRHSGHQPHRRPRRRCGRGARADPSRLGRADPGADRTAAARLRRTRRAGVCSHRRRSRPSSMSPSTRCVLRSSVAAWRSGKPTTSARCTNCSGPANRSSSPTRCARSPGAAPRTIEAYLDELVAPQQVLV